MQRTLVRVRVEFESCEMPEEAAVGLPSKVADGCFEVDFDSSLDLDIDTAEHVLLEACAPALRDALSSRLARVTREHALICAGPTARVIGFCEPYPVDGEVGRFKISTYEVVSPEKTIRSRDFFPTLRGKGQYLTKGFLELALLDGAVEQSYRKTIELINRIRRQVDEGTPTTTLRDVSERAGTKIINSWAAASEEILAEHGFSSDGTTLTADDRGAKLREATSGDTEYTAAEQLQAAKEVGIPREFRQAVEANPVPYDRREEVVDICVDAVLAKKQKSQRNTSADGDSARAQGAAGRNDDAAAPRAADSAEKGRKRQRKSVSTKVAKINCDDVSYCIVAPSYALLFSIVLAFLLRNGHYGRVMCFFVDGERSLNNALLAAFSWHPKVRIILDWYHLTKKCADLLSRALNDRHIRNKHLSQMKHVLWYGAVDAAIAYLRTLDDAHVKAPNEVESLIGYLSKHRERIPCYAIRKQLGLRNSSNAVEKANDDLVSTRQKNRGMSWSREGSLGLAALAAVNSNGHRRAWLNTGSIPLAFAEAA